MRRQPTFIVLVVAMLAGLLLPVQALAQTASPAAETTNPGLAEPVPLGTVATVGDFEIQVVAYQQDASSLLDADTLAMQDSWRQAIAVEVEVTNIGSEPSDTDSFLNMFSGVSGLWAYSYLECNVDNPFGRADVGEPVAPGATETQTICAAINKADVTSLRMQMVPDYWTGEVTDQWMAGTWFDLGAPDSPASTMSAGDLANLASADAAATTMAEAVFAPGGVRVGDLHYQVTSWEADGSAAITAAADQAMLPDPFPKPLLAVTITNLGDRPSNPFVWLLGDDGHALDSAYLSGSLSDPNGSLMPGYQVTRHYAWEDLASVGTNSVLLLSPGTRDSSPYAWTMMTEAPAPTGPAPILDAAPDGAGQTVPLGSEVSLAGVNIQLGQNPSGETPYLATVTMTGEAGAAGLVELWFEQADTSCSITTSAFNSITWSSMASEMLVTGAQALLPVICEESLDASAPIVVTYDRYVDPQTLTFDVTVTASANGSATEPEVAATEAVDETATEVAADDPATTEATGTATVIAATANVRDAATTAGAVVDVVSAGQVVTVTGTSVDADGYTWLPIVTPSGVAGWIASQLIQAES